MIASYGDVRMGDRHRARRNGATEDSLNHEQYDLAHAFILSVICCLF